MCGNVVVQQDFIIVSLQLFMIWSFSTGILLLWDKYPTLPYPTWMREIVLSLVIKCKDIQKLKTFDSSVLGGGVLLGGIWSQTFAIILFFLAFMFVFFKWF